jgi:hypothetical protein
MCERHHFSYMVCFGRCSNKKTNLVEIPDAVVGQFTCGQNFYAFMQRHFCIMLSPVTLRSFMPPSLPKSGLLDLHA